jgi:hypothetical protein
MKSIVSTVRIVELEGAAGWRLEWDRVSHEQHATAVAAQSAVKARDTMLSAAGAPVVVTTIEWWPCSAIGQLVVSAIT